MFKALRFSFVVSALIVSATAGMEHRELYHDPDIYSAWPDIARADNGDLVLSFIRTEQHMSPDGAVTLMH